MIEEVCLDGQVYLVQGVQVLGIFFVRIVMNKYLFQIWFELLFDCFIVFVIILQYFCFYLFNLGEVKIEKF